MSRAILSFLVAFCFFTQGYGESPQEGAPCEDADTCQSLEELKANTYEELRKAIEAGMAPLNKVREKGEKIRKEILENWGTKMIDRIASHQLLKLSNEGNKAFEEALKQGGDLSVFNCIVECEMAAKNQYPENLNEFKHDLKLLQEEPLKTVDATFQKVAAVENELEKTRASYANKIRESYSQIGVSWNRDQALKAFQNILKNTGDIGGGLSGVLEKYQKSTEEVFNNCKATFAQLTTEAEQCMKGCLQQ